MPLAADECRDQRGVSFFETLARDINFALRMFRRAPLVAVTVVSTIALGLGVITVAFTFFNAFFFRVDAVRNPNELFEVERPTRPGFRGHVPFTWTEYQAIRRGTNVFTDVAAARPSIPTRINGRAARGMFVSGNFFDLLGVAATRGRTLTSADNEHGATPVVVMTQLGWEKFFAADPAVVGRELLVNVRSTRVCRRPWRHRRHVSCRRIPSGAARRTHQSDGDAARRLSSERGTTRTRRIPVNALPIIRQDEPVSSSNEASTTLGDRCRNRSTAEL